MGVADHHTLETFRAAFKNAPDDDEVLTPALEEAAVRTPSAVWGNRTQEAHGYLVAHKLGMTEFGADARLEKDETQTSYGVMRERMEEEIGPAAIARVWS